ncbi:hypothetical protein DJ86_661 [Bacillus cereus ATCC 4342]|uniref:hypothetical protein n=1 Tax=Bacillus tropicus TaxID=2026188 RepID=UPI0001A01613|nr:hypothetical protein [Bacillus tropicus]AJH72086.1 hypothetical protein BF35_3915 [Bacillus cereus ATCC 4342]EEK82553.1 hypothetical protein bcere0010_40250 [Bacillus cereus ATCC 4342]KFM89039.1 hypothetical protein DJ86_661 [Bacillus cereus ATCC 4342]MDR4455204.1 hypothetical protein [Bacillus tropicus]QKH55994.1 hypothetical protein FOC76_10955 [Bacillus tropicus]
MSRNLWGDLSNLEEKRNPLDILKEQSGYLLDATNGLIYANIRNREPIGRLGEPEKEFATIFSIRSKMMENYSFEVFALFYNITFFPMTAEVDENLAEALGIDTIYNITDEEHFHSFLEKMLGNDFTQTVITSLYTMSK